MAIFSANTTDLRESGRIIRDCGDNYKTDVANIYTVLGNLSSHWSGGASDQYSASVNSYRADLNNLGSAIINMGQALIGAATSFEQNEEDLANRAKNL